VSGDCCQCDDVRNFVLGDISIHKVFCLLLSSSLAPDNTPRICTAVVLDSQAYIKHYAITGPIFQTIWLMCYDGKTEPAVRRALFISPSNKRREKSLISSRRFSTLNPQ
jgi:hypothetical protein